MLLILFLKKTEDDYTYVLGQSIQTTNGRGYFGLSVYKYHEREILIDRLAVAYRKIIEIIVALFKQENVSLEISGNNWTKTN